MLNEKFYQKIYKKFALNKIEHLASESLCNFTQIGFNFRVWRRFWLLLALYNDGKLYEEVFQSLFTQKYQATAKYHFKV
jgi:hypothetical protein